LIAAFWPEKLERRFWRNRREFLDGKKECSGNWNYLSWEKKPERGQP